MFPPPPSNKEYRACDKQDGGDWRVSEFTVFSTPLGRTMEQGRSLFEDPDFPSDDTSLFFDGMSPISRLRGTVKWMRPQEICQSPRLFPEDLKEGHAKQGILGDCWFLCACTMLLKNTHLMDKVFPPEQPQWGEHGYQGCFHFRLWRFGHWVDVRVDDQLPCLGTRLCFSRCQSPRAFWVPLLEKAYAKLHGAYERLWAGQVAEAIVDLTGGLAEQRSLMDTGNEMDQHSDTGKGRQGLNLSSLQAVSGLCFISGSVHSATVGVSELGQYHALSMMEWTDALLEQGGSVRLLRLRNPWGRRAWGGLWREGGQNWKRLDPACACDLLNRTEDGEFWMDESEFLEEFDEVTVGYPISSQGFVQSIYSGCELPHSHQVGGCWIKGHSAGGCRNNNSFGTNPKFWLHLTEPGEVVVSLMQHGTWRNSTDLQSFSPKEPGGGSMPNDSQYHAIGLHVWKVEKMHFNLVHTLNKPPSLSTHCHAHQREVNAQGSVSAGRYLVVPSTYLQGAEACFLLRVFSNTPVTLSPWKAPTAPLVEDVGGEWETRPFQGFWVPGASAGGSRNFPSHIRNPHVPLSVTLGCDGPNVKVTLRQHCPPKAFLPIGFHIYKVPVGVSRPQITQNQEPQVSCVPHCYAHEVSLQCRLSPGAYVIVPSTYQPDCKGSFTLTIARKVLRKVVKSQEFLGNMIQDVSHISLMHS